jgi:uncharacterized protein (TIGR02466 family)
MNSTPLFYSDMLTKSKVGSSFQISNVLAQIKQEQITTLTTENTNEGCWRSQKRWNNLNWLLDELSDLVSTAVDHYQQLDSGCQLSKKFGIEMWTNVNSPNSRNVLHSHKSANFSAVYYLQSTGTGNLRLLNPANMLGDCNRRGPFTRDFEFSPTDGDLILWPAWIPHEVDVNLSNQDRINLVFDIYVE